ncbi:MAG TPA: hypothetical protein VLB01_07925 [Thermodesulfobacteriota bacterium]|nr:hypothetical protein [Thermodesulfobacteriota bacterium]
MARASNTCHTTLTSGSGTNYMQVCISNHGNLINFKSPSSSVDHISHEGYAICDNPGGAEFVSGYDAGSSEGGCGNPTISQPNGANTLPLTITRQCACIKFKQEFSRDTTEKDITITMTLTNICNFTLFNNRVVRYFNGDILGDAGFDIYDKSLDSVWARDNYALSLTALTFGVNHNTWVELLAEWRDSTVSGCRIMEENTPTPPGDFVGNVIYFLGTLNQNQSKTVKVVYRRQ